MKIDLSASEDTWRPFMFGGVRPVVAFLIGFTALVLVSNLLWNALFNVEAGLRTAPVNLYNAWGAASSALQFALAAFVLKYEDVNLRDIGLAPRLLVPALTAGAAVVVALNLAVAGLGVSTGSSLSFGFYPQYQSLLPEASAVMLGATGVHHYLFTGPAEELAFRGYLQNKLVTLFGDVTLGTRAAAIAVASVSFGLLHLPIALFGSDLTVGGVVAAILLSTVSGVVFGTIYELTRNLYLVAILHGFGDWWPIFLDAGGVAWPNWGVIILLYTVLVVAYRWWAKQAPRTTLGAAPVD